MCFVYERKKNYKKEEGLNGKDTHKELLNRAPRVARIALFLSNKLTVF